MISLIHYISAKRRLKESKKTVMMLGGRDECPPMVLAQTDMIELEVEYYREEVGKLMNRTLLFMFIVLISFMSYIFYERLS